MFGGARGRNGRGRAPQVDTLIGGRVSIRGDISFSGGLYVEGRVHGAVTAEDGAAVLTVADNGLVEGEVRAPVVVVSGQLHGDVYASERIELAASARVVGNVHYKVVQMVAGAMVTGRLIHAGTAQALPAPESGPAIEHAVRARPDAEHGDDPGGPAWIQQRAG